jgi:hypothetical protein
MEVTDFPKLKVKREEPVNGAAAFITVIQTKDGQMIIGAAKKSSIYNTCLRLGVNCNSDKFQKVAFVELKPEDKNGA